MKIAEEPKAGWFESDSAGLLATPCENQWTFTAPTPIAETPF